MADILCPYCMSKVTAAAIKYACPLCGNTVEPGMLERMRHIAPACKNKECNKHLATERRCPTCEARLPGDILDYSKYLRFSILGISGAGKTNFLTTMLHETRQAGLPLVLTPMDNDTQLIFRQNERMIYDDKVPVPATPPGTPPQPQQWKVQDKSRMTNRMIPSYSLTIFDGAGEDQENIDPVISRYIEGSKTLVILIDPLALKGVRRLADKNILDWSSAAEHMEEASADLVNGIANYIRQSTNKKTGTVIDKDVAVVFTKMDAVFDSFGSAVVTKPSPHVGAKKFVKSDGQAVDLEIRNWLAHQGEQSFLDAVDINFNKKRVCYFGVSSFGQPPKGAGQLGMVVPHRVMDPLIWMMAKEGLLPTA